MKTKQIYLFLNLYFRQGHLAKDHRLDMTLKFSHHHFYKMIIKKFKIKYLMKN